MNEINVKVTLRNNILLGLMRDNQIRTGAELARITGVRETPICNLLRLKKDAPFNKKGTYRRHCKIIARFFRVTEDYLFPKELYSLEKTEACTTVSISNLMPSLQDSPEIEYLKKNALCLLHSKVKTLDDRTQDVLWKRAEGYTFEQIGQSHGVTTERVRQIEAKGLRRLRARMNGTRELYSEVLNG